MLQGRALGVEAGFAFEATAGNLGLPYLKDRS